MATQVYRDLEQIGFRARQASRTLAQASSQQKHAALLALADALGTQVGAILEANRQDVQSAQLAGLGSAAVDRLRLDEKRLEAMANGVRAIAALHDPVGETLRE